MIVFLLTHTLPSKVDRHQPARTGIRFASKRARDGFCHRDIRFESHGLFVRVRRHLSLVSKELSSSQNQHEQLSVLRSSSALKHHALARSVAAGIARSQESEAKALAPYFCRSNPRKNSQAERCGWLVGLILVGGIFP